MAGVDTANTGEGLNESTSIKAWMATNTEFQPLLDDTYHKLESHGFTTIKHLRAVTVSEMTEYLKQMDIKLSDHSPLKRAVEILGNKQRFVDPEEIKVMKSMQLKIKQFENSMNHESAKQESVSKQAKQIQSQIDMCFDQMIQKLNERKTALSEKLEQIKLRKIAQIKARMEAYNESMKSLQQIKQENNALMNQAIDIHELDARKAKILSNEQKVMQIVEKTMKQSHPAINYKMNAVLDTANMIQLINTFGAISDVSIPVLVQLKHDNNVGAVDVVWRLDIEEKENEESSGKLSVEYGRLNANEHEVTQQQSKKKEIEIETRKSGTEKIAIDSIGTYLFKLRYYDNANKVWSSFSNAKTIHIQQIAPSIDSTVLTVDEKRTLLQFVKQRLGDNQYRFTLLLRSSRNGGSKEKFHELCDNKGATLIIVKSKKYNHVFGGYTSVPWNTSDGWQSDEGAFLFLLRSSFGHSPKLINIKQAGYAVYHASDRGWYMPNNGAICISRSNSRNWSDIDASYIDDVKGNALCGGDTYREERKRYDFELDNYEVFSLHRV